MPKKIYTDVIFETLKAICFRSLNFKKIDVTIDITTEQ